MRELGRRGLGEIELRTRKLGGEELGEAELSGRELGRRELGGAWPTGACWDEVWC